MTHEKLAEIRARHEAVDNVLRGAAQMHDDRGYLLAEVDRLRAYVTQILLIAHENIACRNECGRLCRDALEGKP